MFELFELVAKLVSRGARRIRTPRPNNHFAARRRFNLESLRTKETMAKILVSMKDGGSRKRILQSPLEMPRSRRSQIKAALERLLLQVHVGPEKPKSTNPLLIINCRIACEEVSVTGLAPLLSDREVTELKSPRHNQAPLKAVLIPNSWSQNRRLSCQRVGPYTRVTI